MTSSLIRNRQRRAAVRVARAGLGGATGLVWFVLPGMTISADDPVPAARAGTVVQVSQEVDETSTADLVLPLVAASAAVGLAGYAYLRRTRRARTRTTPGGVPVVVPPPPLAELDEQARALLVEADDWVRTSREELGFAEALFGTAAVAPFARAVRDAEGELSAAFRMRQQYDDGVPADGASRRHALAGIVGRCQEAGRRLDAEAAGFDQLRGLERGVGEALEVAETRFRELTSRTAAVQATLADLGKRYAPSATATVTGHVEQAKDRLVFATSRLNEAHQAADSDENDRAAQHLRAAESAIAQATAFLNTTDRLAQSLTEAATIVPATLTGAEVELAGARGWLAEAEAGMEPTGGDRGMSGTETEPGDGADWTPGSWAVGISTWANDGASGPGLASDGEVGRAPGRGAGGVGTPADDGAGAPGGGEGGGSTPSDGEAEGGEAGGPSSPADHGAGGRRREHAPGSPGTRSDVGTGSPGSATGGEAGGVGGVGGVGTSTGYGAGGASGGSVPGVISGGSVGPVGGVSGMGVGELRARIRHADGVLAGVREEVVGGSYDPLDALRRIVRAVVAVESGRVGVLAAAALLAARESVGLADGFVVTHRGAVGGEARTRLAEAVRLLAAGPEERVAAGLRARAGVDQRRAPGLGRMPAAARTMTGDRVTADTLARHAHALAEQDVRVHGNPVAGAAERELGVGGALLGGILLGGAPDCGPPASFGGPRTRARRGGSTATSTTRR
ncbi:tropomyosin [Streptomyces sp. NBC_00457]|uniref:hypothetical protein n=1 Tax=Streptomyces sp. NBC_00457 TaxID=2975748 RepID=UPI002E1DBD25